MKNKKKEHLYKNKGSWKCYAHQQPISVEKQYDLLLASVTMGTPWGVSTTSATVSLPD